MPVLHIYSPLDAPPPNPLKALCQRILDVLQMPPNHCWSIWHEIAPHNYCRPGWQYGAPSNGPIVLMHCKSIYSARDVEKVLIAISDILSAGLACDPRDIYVAVHRVVPGETLVRGEV